jgi:hypothetical protein
MDGDACGSSEGRRHGCEVLRAEPVILRLVGACAPFARRRAPSAMISVPARAPVPGGGACEGLRFCGGRRRLGLSAAWRMLAGGGGGQPYARARQPDLAAGRRGGRRFQNQGSRRPAKVSAAGRPPAAYEAEIALRDPRVQHRYSPGKTLGSGDRSDTNVGKLRDPVDKPVSVFSAPGNHDLAMLEPGVKGEASWLAGAGAAFFLFGLGVFSRGFAPITRDK